MILIKGMIIYQKQIFFLVEQGFRQGTRLVETATIALNRPLLEYSRQYDIPPDYVVFAGLTFVKISRNFLETWGSDWYSGLPHALRYVFQFGQELNTDRQRRRKIRESEVIRTARAAVRELGVKASVSDVERAVCKKLGLSFGETLVWTLHELCEAQRRAERREREADRS